MTAAGDDVPLAAGSPHDIAASPPLAAHLYHALAVKGALPVGRDASSALPAAGAAARKLAPLANESELFAAPKTPAAKAAPPGAPPKAATPSACEPER